MTDSQSSVETLYFDDDALMLLDQRRLPHAIEYVECRDVEAVVEAIRNMVVRGAPAIGIAAAFGVVLAAARAFEQHGTQWTRAVRSDLSALRAARPTAVNLGWAVDAMLARFDAIEGDPKAPLLDVAVAMHAHDISDNKKMGDFGAALLSPAANVITHCNAGALATAGYGTALGVIRSAWRDGRVSNVFACETRPWLQGARLTAWELRQDGIAVTLLADSAAAALMRGGEISWVITGADRIAANGDVANKIGTYQHALSARANGVRFMVAAPTSTIDRDTPNGAAIPIEQREAEELTSFRGERVAAAGVATYNPVFDITEAGLVDVLVTEKGVIERPNKESIARLFEA